MTQYWSDFKTWKAISLGTEDYFTKHEIRRRSRDQGRYIAGEVCKQMDRFGGWPSELLGAVQEGQVGLRNLQTSSTTAPTISSWQRQSWRVRRAVVWRHLQGWRCPIIVSSFSGSAALSPTVSWVCKHMSGVLLVGWPWQWLWGKWSPNRFWNWATTRLRIFRNPSHICIV